MNRRRHLLFLRINVYWNTYQKLLVIKFIELLESLSVIYGRKHTQGSILLTQ